MVTPGPLTGQVGQPLLTQPHALSISDQIAVNGRHWAAGPHIEGMEVAWAQVEGNGASFSVSLNLASVLASALVGSGAGSTLGTIRAETGRVTTLGTGGRLSAQAAAAPANTSILQQMLGAGGSPASQPAAQTRYCRWVAGNEETQWQNRYRDGPLWGNWSIMKHRCGRTKHAVLELRQEDSQHG